MSVEPYTVLRLASLSSLTSTPRTKKWLTLKRKTPAYSFLRAGRERNSPSATQAGGFAYVGAMHDSFPQALDLSKKGYNAFALIYRPGAQTACEDLARAIAFIHEHADELEVDTDCYSLWGGSAGARMAAYLGSCGTDAKVKVFEGLPHGFDWAPAQWPRAGLTGRWSSGKGREK